VLRLLFYLLPRALARGRVKADKGALAQKISIIVGLKSSGCFCNTIHDLKVVAIEKVIYV